MKVNENGHAHQVKKAKSQRDWVPNGLTRWAVLRASSLTDGYASQERQPRRAEAENGSWWRGTVKQKDDKDEVITLLV